MVRLADIQGVLATIPDPEMPISIVDLGLVEDVAVDEAARRVTVTMLPTFVGCPALDMIRDDVRAKVGALPGVDDVAVDWIFDPPWTVDRITDAGREQLREHGVDVPARGPLPRPAAAVTLRTSAVACPFCGSRDTELDSPFGPTRCRAIWYCRGCRNAFERMKRLGSR